MKAAADLIVHSAVGHLVERQRDHVQRMLIAGSMVIAQQKIDAHARRKLRRAAEAALTRIEAAAHARYAASSTDAIDGRLRVFRNAC